MCCSGHRAYVGQLTMIKYRQLIKGSGKTRKNLWYICGSEPALISDSLDIAKAHITGGVSSVCSGVFSGTTDSGDIVDFINRPYYEERKIIIIHDASKVPDIHSIIDLGDTSTFYVLVDYGYGLASNELLTLLTNNSSARSVDCSKPTTQDLQLLINSRLNMSDSAVRTLIAHSNGDSEWMLNKIRVLEYLQTDEITAKIVGLVCTDDGIAPFEESLLQFDKRQCFLYIKSMGTEKIRLNRIIEDVHNLSLLNVVSGTYSKQIRPITDKTGLTKNQVDGYMSNIPYYDGETSKRCLNSLMRLHDRLQRDDRLAYVALVCGW